MGEDGTLSLVLCLRLSSLCPLVGLPIITLSIHPLFLPLSQRSLFASSELSRSAARLCQTAPRITVAPPLCRSVPTVSSFGLIGTPPLSSGALTNRSPFASPISRRPVQASSVRRSPSATRPAVAIHATATVRYPVKERLHTPRLALNPPQSWGVIPSSGTSPRAPAVAAVADRRPPPTPKSSRSGTPGRPVTTAEN